MAITKADIAARFNTLIINALNTPTAGTAPWYSGNVPFSGTIAPIPAGVPRANMEASDQLGPQAEPLKTAADIPGTNLVCVTLFNALHGLAMELTRVRKSQFIFYYGSPFVPVGHVDYNSNPTTIMGRSTAALHPRFALYFPIPGGQRDPGTAITATALDEFLDDLYEQIQHIRSDDIYMHTITATASCHSSCHSSCHGSRGRR